MPSASPRFDLIGVGSPIMDLLARVPEEFLSHVPGAKGGMVLLEPTEMAAIVARLDPMPVFVPGGSAANTVLGATRLGLKSTFLGKLGNDDIARAYHQNFIAAGGDSSRFKAHAELPNARCLSLITPDSQRTMRTCLGAAMTLHAGEISPDDFRDCRHAHIEGYVLFNRDLATAVMKSARAAGCTISLDLAAFEVVNAARDWIFEQLKQGIDVVFANEDEIRALYQSNESYDTFAKRLASHGGIAAVKMGKDGAWVAQGQELHRIGPVEVAPHQVIDTTGAGDAWAAGFLFGYLRGYTLATSGALGSVLGAEIVQHIGPAIPDSHWPRLVAHAKKLRV